MESIWKMYDNMPEFSPLDTDLKTDVLIVGGGLAGLLCASRLKQAGIRCCVVEAGRICGGATGNTTAKITSQHGLIYGKLLKQFGREAARQYWELQEMAIREIRHMAEKINCDFQTCVHGIYSSSDTSALTQERDALRTLEIPFVYRDTLPLPVDVNGVLEFTDQGQFHPLKFAAGIAENLEIYEQTPVREFTKHGVITDRGRIRAEAVIVATHFPILNKHGGYFVKLYQQRSYVLAVENAMDVQGMYLAAEEGGFSFRNQGSALILGHGGHRTGKENSGWQELEGLVQRRFPAGKIIARWANQDCMTLDGLPYVGRYSRGTPDLYVATGFNKWGMTNSMAAAMVLTDMIQGRESPYEKLLSPARSVLRPQLAVNLLESSASLLTLKRPRCPHLGCALQWNPREHSWDCPCHGSRFSEDGKLLDGPANGDLPQ